MAVQIRSDGTWLTTVAQWGELQWSHAADGGCKEASWKMDLPATFSHPTLKRGAIIELRTGPENVWKGFISDVDPDEDWSVTALGLSKLGDTDYLCFDALGNTTSVPDVAIDQAVSRGLPWSRPVSISAAAFAATDTTSDLNYVGELLDAYADQNTSKWVVNPDGEVRIVAPPTVPTWHLTPAAGRFGLADDDYASDVFVRYLASGAGYATATAGDAVARSKFRRREYRVDATARGIMSPTTATAFAQSLVDKGRARQGYVNGITVSKSQLTTPGGTPADLTMVQGNQMVRMFGVSDEQGPPLPYLDWVIGETSLEAGGTTIGLTPVGLLPRTLGDIMEASVA